MTPSARHSTSSTSRHRSSFPAIAGEAHRLNAILRAAAHATAERAGEDLLGKAQRLAPVREGTLRGAGELEVHETIGGAEAIVSFNTIYAARQHEETEWEHPKGGQAKYLEQPLRESAHSYQRLAAAELAARLKG